MSTIVTVPLLGALIGCQQGPQVVTSIVFDGESRSITITDVFCTNQLNGGLVILVQDTPTRTVRVQLTQQGRLVVQKAGLRYGDMTGFVADPREVTASKADDTFRWSVRSWMAQPRTYSSLSASACFATSSENAPTA